MIKYKYIAIEGNIGAGKTTLARFLADWLNGSLLLEEFEKNPFLKAFYNGKDFAVHSELQFILDRSRQLSEFFSKDHGLIISDYVPEKSLIFSKMNLSEKDYKIIKQLTNVLYQPFKKPDLIIFIDRSLNDLMQKIFLRGRDFEQKIDKSYIERLSIGYEKWLKTISYPVLRINANEIDINNPKKLIDAFKIILEQDYQHIQRRIHLKELIN